MKLAAGLLYSPWALVIAAAVGFGTGVMVEGWRKGAEVSSLLADAATTTSQRAGVALTASEAYRGAEATSFQKLSGASHAFEKTTMADMAAGARADAADAGLWSAIDSTIAAAAGGDGVPEGAAAERSRQAIAALGTSLGECSKRRTAVAKQLAESQRRHQRCEAEHQAAEALNLQPIQRGRVEAQEH